MIEKNKIMIYLKRIIKGMNKYIDDINKKIYKKTEAKSQKPMF